MIQEMIGLRYISCMIKINLVSPTGLYVPLWNSSPDYVGSSPTTNAFKACLDQFWEKQDVRYNWKADILFTGDGVTVELSVESIFFGNIFLFFSF